MIIVLTLSRAALRAFPAGILRTKTPPSVWEDVISDMTPDDSELTIGGTVTDTVLGRVDPMASI
jgi:hypothetical protein